MGGGCSTNAHNAEKEIRKIAIARLYPSDYIRVRELACPRTCEGITRIYKKSAMDCADQYGRNEDCDRERAMFLVCEAIRKEAENIRKPVKELEEEVEKYKRDVIAEAKAKGSF